MYLTRMKTPTFLGFYMKVIDMKNFKLRSLLAILLLKHSLKIQSFIFSLGSIYVCVFADDMLKSYFEIKVSKHSDLLLIS